MNFLEAHRLVKGFAGGEELSFLLAASGTVEPLDLYLRAHAARRGRTLSYRTLPFNTLAQWSFSPVEEDANEVALLLPWDLVPEADWRSGVPAAAVDAASLKERAIELAERLRRRSNLRILYIPAPIPPLFPDHRQDGELSIWLLELVQSLGARPLPANTFALGSYLASGTPISSASMSGVADAIVDTAARSDVAGKVLVTDLDQVMWAGVIGEDGAEGIECGPEGTGYRHFLYQTVLAKLEREGILLAAVSKNDPDLAAAPFHGGRTVLKESQFVSILASYHAKSAQISALADRLNLGLDSFVFVDDNPVELAEVAAALPKVRCLQFPITEDGIPTFLGELAALFSRRVVTDEDRQRTEMYRRRLEGLAPDSASGADLTAFLQGLEMRLEIRDRSSGDRTRAVQLINKTNQFNLNGQRIEDEEVGRVLAAGGRLFTATLEDRNGSHGEILACLLTGDGTVRSLVMSCRVMQRRVEYAFLTWLAQSEQAPRMLEFRSTDRNSPLRTFLEDRAFSVAGDEGVVFQPEQFIADHRDNLALFEISELGKIDAAPIATAF